MISVSDHPSCTRTRKYARDDIPITVGTSERRSTSLGALSRFLGVTMTNAHERLFGDGTEARSQVEWTGASPCNREGARLLAAKGNFLRIHFLKNTIRSTCFINLIRMESAVPSHPKTPAAMRLRRSPAPSRCGARPREDGSLRTFGSGAISIRSAGSQTAGLGESWLVAHEESRRAKFSSLQSLEKSQNAEGFSSPRAARSSRTCRIGARSSRSAEILLPAKP